MKDAWHKLHEGDKVVFIKGKMNGLDFTGDRATVDEIYADRDGLHICVSLDNQKHNYCGIRVRTTEEYIELAPDCKRFKHLRGLYDRSL